MIPPGSTIGILGGGQLGRMLAIAAANLGYRTHIYAPGMSGPATEVAACWTAGAFEDAAAIAAFAAQVDFITYEFENVVVDAIRDLPGIFPSARSLEVSQDRAIEKAFAEEQGGRPAPWYAVASIEELQRALVALGTPAILKTRRFGYDGKGQARIRTIEDAAEAWAAIGGAPAVLEGMVQFDAEFSILLARTADGRTAVWDAVENEHRDGVLHRSSVPASPLIAAQAEQAKALATRIADALGHVGVLACEFFACADGPVFNEMAPRVHNSGHWTIEGAVTSQFENHIRAICDLPLGSTALVGQHAEMINLLGKDAEDWPTLLAEPAAHLHLYGKGKPKPGRKMGHVTRVG